MVQTTKSLLTKSDDPYEALLAYRATTLENGFSPAELCTGRRLRTTLPTTTSKLTPQWPELTKLREKEGKIKTEQTKDYNRRQAVKELSHLSPGDRVYIPDRKENAVVVAKTQSHVPITSTLTVTQLLEETDGSSIQILKKQSAQQEALYPILLKLLRISHLFQQRRKILYRLLKSLLF